MRLYYYLILNHYTYWFFSSFLLATTISTSTNLASHQQQTTGWVTSTTSLPDRDQRPRSSTAPVIVATVPTNKTDRKSKEINYKNLCTIIFCIHSLILHFYLQFIQIHRLLGKKFAPMIMYVLGPLNNIGQILVCLKHLLLGGIKQIRQASEIKK